MIAYKFDGTKDGILCCLFESFTKKEQPFAIFSSDFQPSFDTTVKEIETNSENAERVEKGIVKYGGITLLSELFYILRSNDPTKETVIFMVAKRCLEERKNIISDYKDTNVLSHFELRRKIGLEAHRFKGFLRFEELLDGCMYAHFEPDNDIIDLVAPHFAKRFSNEKFVIHDTKRNLLALYYKNQIKIIQNDQPVVAYLSKDETEFKALWQTYFKSVSIKERKNTRLQDNYLPRRYRKNMSEFK